MSFAAGFGNHSYNCVCVCVCVCVCNGERAYTSGQVL